MLADFYWASDDGILTPADLDTLSLITTASDISGLKSCDIPMLGASDIKSPGNSPLKSPTRSILHALDIKERGMSPLKSSDIPILSAYEVKMPGKLPLKSSSIPIVTAADIKSPETSPLKSSLVPVISALDIKASSTSPLKSTLGQLTMKCAPPLKSTLGQLTMKCSPDVSPLKSLTNEIILKSPDIPTLDTPQNLLLLQSSDIAIFKSSDIPILNLKSPDMSDLEILDVPLEMSTMKSPDVCALKSQDLSIPTPLLVTKSNSVPKLGSSVTVLKSCEPALSLGTEVLVSTPAADATVVSADIAVAGNNARTPTPGMGQSELMDMLLDEALLKSVTEPTGVNPERSTETSTSEVLLEGAVSGDTCESDKSTDAAPRTTCPYCGVNIPDGSNRRRHIITHTGEKPFECELCGRKFARKAHVDRHKTTHKLMDGTQKDS